MHPGCLWLTSLALRPLLSPDNNAEYLSGQETGRGFVYVFAENYPTHSPWRVNLFMPHQNERWFVNKTIPYPVPGWSHWCLVSKSPETFLGLGVGGLAPIAVMQRHRSGKKSQAGARKTEARMVTDSLNCCCPKLYSLRICYEQSKINPILQFFKGQKAIKDLLTNAVLKGG